MLDIKFIKENKDVVAAAIKNKKCDVDLDLLLELAEAKRALRQKLDELNQKRNEAAKTRNIELGSQLKKEAEELEEKFAEADKKFLALMLKVPNIPSLDTPIGPDESANKVIKTVGEPKKFDFEPKDHVALGESLGLIDTETASRVSGARFTYILGDLVLIQFAILQFCLKFLSDKSALEQIAKAANLNISVAPFKLVLPPVFVKPAVQNRMARFLTPEEHYLFPNDDLMLVGSAEHTLGPIHMDQVLEEKSLSLRYAGYSPAFRREAGAYGKDMKGILRLHQFDKLELEVFSLPEQSMNEQNFLVALQEHLLQALELPYQVMMISTGDMGFPDHRQIDINTWMPGQNRYRETHTSDLMTSFQGRRLNTRVKRKDGKVEPIHTNDATLAAMGRLLIAIMENYQQADGSIRIPKVLVPYVGKEVISKS